MQSIVAAVFSLKNRLTNNGKPVISKSLIVFIPFIASYFLNKLKVLYYITTKKEDYLFFLVFFAGSSDSITLVP